MRTPSGRCGKSGAGEIQRVTVFLYPRKNATPFSGLVHARLPFVFPLEGARRFDGRPSRRHSLISSKLANKSLHRERRCAEAALRRARVHPGEERHHKIGIQYRKRGPGNRKREERGTGHVVCVTAMSRGAGFTGTAKRHAHHTQKRACTRVGRGYSRKRERENGEKHPLAQLRRIFSLHSVSDFQRETPDTQWSSVFSLCV